MKPVRRPDPTTGIPAADRPAGPVLRFDYGTERTGVAVGQMAAAGDGAAERAALLRQWAAAAQAPASGRGAARSAQR